MTRLEKAHIRVATAQAELNAAQVELELAQDEINDAAKGLGPGDRVYWHQDGYLMEGDFQAFASAQAAYISAPDTQDDIKEVDIAKLYRPPKGSSMLDPITRDELKRLLKVNLNACPVPEDPAENPPFEERILQYLERMNRMNGGIKTTDLDNLTVTINVTKDEYAYAKLSSAMQELIWNTLRRYCLRRVDNDRLAPPYDYPTTGWLD